MRTFFAALNRAAIFPLLLVTSAFSVPPAFAAEGGARPEQTVMEITKQLKLSGDETAVLEYVDWPEAFSRTPLSSRESLNIKSAEDLKAFYVEALTNSPLLGLRRAGPMLAQLPPEKRKELEKQTERLGRHAGQTAGGNRFANTLFEYKKTIVDPEYATVQLYVTDQGKTNEVYVQLIKRNERWVLPCVQIVEDPLKLCR